MYEPTRIIIMFDEDENEKKKSCVYEIMYTIMYNDDNKKHMSLESLP
jgi:hypothetical protein